MQGKDKIKAARVAAGFTSQQDLAFAVGCSVSQISKLEAGASDLQNMRLRNVQDIATALGLTLDEIAALSVDDPE